jgi:ParB-like chromosome segregation protein Spo0J
MKEFKAQIQWVPPESITPYPNNIKKHPVHQIDKIAGQISEFGFDQPIVVDKNKVIIKGHGRRAAALRLGLKEVPIIISDLTDMEAKAARMGDNKVAESDWDEDMLRFELGTLQRNEYDLGLTGFEVGELDKLMADPVETESSTSDDQETQQEAQTQYVVAVECKDENDMQKIYDEMTGKGYSCKLIT